MAPMRSHLFHLFHTLKTDRKVTFWYGDAVARAVLLGRFQQNRSGVPNFDFHVVLSEPEEDDWKVKKDVNDEGTVSSVLCTMRSLNTSWRTTMHRGH